MAKSGQSSKSPKYIRLIINTMHLSGVLNIVKVLKFAFLRNDTFPRCQSGHRIHRPLSPHSPFPPPGKVPGFPAKTVHFPPRPDGVLAPQALLAALAISTPGESAVIFRENGSLSPRGCLGYWLHSRLSPHLAFPPPGKVPGISAKTVHFPPRPAVAPAPHATLAALAVSTLGESAGNSCENGSLSPVARRGTGSTDPSRRTRRFHLRGKCRVFPRKRFTFPRGRQGHRLHSRLSPHSPFPPPGKVPGFPAKTVHFPPVA